MISRKTVIAVQPLGCVEGGVPEAVAATLEKVYRIPTRVLPERPVPGSAYNVHRGQHNCYPILRHLNRLKPQHAVKIIGITHVDLFIPILTYVFGEAELGGQATVVSTCRLSRGADNEPLAMDQTLERAKKIAVHELAHTFRLQHCRETRCIMGSFPALTTIDEQPIEFCRYCKVFLKDEYEKLDLV